MSVGSVGFDLQGLNNRLSQIDAKGPTSRNLQSAWAVAQAVAGALYGLENTYPAYLTNEDGSLGTEVVAGETGPATDDATAEFTFTLAKHPVVPGTLSLSFILHGDNGAGLAVDDGQGGITSTELDSGTINYRTGEISLVFTTGKEPFTGTIDAGYTYDIYGDTLNTAIAGMQVAVANLFTLVNK